MKQKLITALMCIICSALSVLAFAQVNDPAHTRAGQLQISGQPAIDYKVSSTDYRTNIHVEMLNAGRQATVRGRIVSKGGKEVVAWVSMSVGKRLAKDFSIAGLKEGSYMLELSIDSQTQTVSFERNLGGIYIDTQN